MFIGHDDLTVTPMMEWRQNVSSTCTGFDGGCFKYPLVKLQNHDTDLGLSFYFVLHVYNIAGHFTTLKTTTFKIPSKYPPGHSIVSDVDPSLVLDNIKDDMRFPFKDINAHFSVHTVCVSWTEFKHSADVFVNFAISTPNHQGYIYGFKRINNTGLHCITDDSIPINVKLIVHLRATSSGGSTISTSNGVTIYDPALVWKRFNVLDGPECITEENMISSIKLDTTNVTNDIGINKSLILGKLYTIRIISYLQPNLTFKIESSDFIVHHTDTTEFYVDNVIQTMSTSIRFKIIVPAQSNIYMKRVQLYPCQDKISVQHDLQSIEAHWTNLSRHFDYESAVVSLLCSNISDQTCVQYVTPLHRSHANSMQQSGLSLHAHVKYNVLARPCLNTVCLPPKTSYGILAEFKDALVHIIMPKMTRSKCISFNIQWRINSIGIAFYQWTISSSKAIDRGPYLVIPWTMALPSKTNTTAVQVNLLLLFLHKHKVKLGSTMVN